MQQNFEEFAKSERELEIWNNGELVFQSDKKMVGGLLDFIQDGASRFTDLTIFDKRAGNAVALLCAYSGVKEIYAVLGSQAAAKTFDEFKIKFHFLETIPHILNQAENDICPLEKKSFSKNPEEFYQAIKI